MYSVTMGWVSVNKALTKEPSTKMEQNLMMMVSIIIMNIKMEHGTMIKDLII